MQVQEKGFFMRWNKAAHRCSCLALLVLMCVSWYVIEARLCRQTSVTSVLSDVIMHNFECM